MAENYLFLTCGNCHVCDEILGFGRFFISQVQLESLLQESWQFKYHELMAVVARKVPELLEDLALFDPFRRIEDDCGIDLVLFVRLDEIKCEMGDPFVF